MPIRRANVSKISLSAKKLANYLHFFKRICIFTTLSADYAIKKTPENEKSSE